MSEADVYPRILAVGEAAFTVEFGDAVDAELNHRVHDFDATLQSHPVPGLIERVPTYRSLLVTFDLLSVDAGHVESELRDRLAESFVAVSSADPELEPGRIFEIPVRYGGEFGPDLLDVAIHCALDPLEVVRQHTAPIYQVAMLGFAPGFTYLLNLPETLVTPRLATPRLRVPAGSVGIAGGQTGIYALSTPGGWRVIGRTDLSLFDASSDQPFLVRAGDSVRFMPIGDYA